MKKRFTDEQIISILREAETGAMSIKVSVNSDVAFNGTCGRSANDGWWVASPASNPRSLVNAVDRRWPAIASRKGVPP